MSWFQKAADSRVNSVHAPSRSQMTPRPWRMRRWAIAAGLLAVIGLIAFPRGWLLWQLYSARNELSKGNAPSAIPRLQHVIKYAPQSAEAHYRLAVAERRAGHLDQVLKPLESAQKLGWNKEDIERQTLLSIAQNGEIDSVNSRIKSIMGRGASDEAAEEIYEALSIGFLKTYRLKEAWDCLNFWSEWKPKAIFPKYWRADICRRIDNPTAEEQEYREILAIDPRYLNARSRLAEVLKDSNRIEAAAREFELGLVQAPNRPDLLIGAAECERRLGNVNKAIPLLQHVMTLNLSTVERATALSHQGQIEADAGRWIDAIGNLEKAIQLDPAEASIWFALSQAYSSSGELQKSQEALERSKQVRSQRERVEEIARVLVDRPGNADLRYEAGKILIDMGMKEDGAAWLQTALQMQPTHPQAREALETYLHDREVGSSGQSK